MALFLYSITITYLKMSPEKGRRQRQVGAGDWEALENGSRWSRWKALENGRRWNGSRWRMAVGEWQALVGAVDYHSPAPRFLWPLHFCGPYGGVMKKCLPLREILPLFAIICDLAPGYA